MIRTQIQLTEEQMRALRAVARRDGLSLAEVVRRCVDAGLAGPLADRSPLYERARGLVGAFADQDAARDLARRHDRYLEQAYR